MNTFSTLPVFWQMLIPVLLLLEATLELGLLLYQLLRSPKPTRSLHCIAHFVLLFVLLFAVTQGDPDEGKDAFLLGAPWLLFAVVILLAALHFAVALPREYRRRKNELSPASIREATDKLPMGVCFADPDGRIVLCNRQMHALSFALGGGEMQILADAETMLDRPQPAVAVRHMADSAACYCLPDKTVWQFSARQITVDGDDRWHQLAAQNVTALYRANVRQAEINRELHDVNRRLQAMYARMADDVREKESLDMKVRIHDAIGRSLLTIRDILASDADTEKKLHSLKAAVRVLAADRAAPQSTLDEVRESADALGVAVRTEGTLPPDTAAEALTALAVRECVTNCIRHAGGNVVCVRITERGDLCDVVITNNGKKPDGPIAEGSGLSSLRRRIEAAGGEMHTAYNPRFALLLTFSRKENEL